MKTTQQPDAPFDRYRRHAQTVVRIDGAGYMTIQQAQDGGHLARVSKGVYRPLSTTTNESKPQ